ncbi:hypothetical protein V6N13_139939 [Hibiscus sabdariffa]
MDQVNQKRQENQEANKNQDNKESENDKKSQATPQEEKQSMKGQESQETPREHDSLRNREVSLFVENIPSRMHWKGLCKAEAWKALGRLNGYIVYGFRLSVKWANQMVRKSGGLQKQQTPFLGSNVHHMGSDGKTRGLEPVKKKILCHVVEAKLWKMKMCLVREMPSICSIHSISSRLQDWGLNDIKVQQMGGKVFLLSFEHDELYIMLEDLELVLS